MPQSSVRRVVVPILLIVIGGFVALFLIVAALLSVPSEPRSTETVTAVPTPTPNAPRSTPPSTPDEAIRASLARHFGDRLRSVSVSPALTIIQFDVADGLTQGLRRYEAKRDVLRVLEAAHRALGPAESRIAVFGFSPMQDQYGNVESRRIVMVRFARSELAKINWSQIDTDRVYDLAEAQTVHPKFR